MNGRIESVEGAVYCRIPHRDGPDQTNVGEREARCRRTAHELGISVTSRHVYVDHRRTVWHRDGPRPAWRAMVAAARANQVGHVIIDEPDELLRRQPGDFATLLAIAEEHSLALHAPASRWDLNDPAVRRALGR